MFRTNSKNAFFVLDSKVERKKLKAEKLDLLNQMKQLYGTLEDKEKELRDFIRSFEQVSERHPLTYGELLCVTVIDRIPPSPARSQNNKNLNHKARKCVPSIFISFINLFNFWL